MLENALDSLVTTILSDGILTVLHTGYYAKFYEPYVFELLFLILVFESILWFICHYLQPKQI